MRTAIVVLIVMLIQNFGFTQTKFTEFKAGVLNPENAKTGFMGGVNFGRSVDENVGVSFAADVYRRSYTDETVIYQAETSNGVVEEQFQTESEQSTTMIPLFFQLHYQGPVSNIFNIRVSGGLGYEFLWNSITNYNTGEDNTKFFHGFGWHVDLGAMYPLSRASDIFAEVTYHGGKPGKGEGKNEAGLPIRKEINMSGFGVRIGMRIYNFGF
ncbi:MAG: outer membrane beta-barrel protein [Caldithrix sp.]|nr:outer membrane beta-barrel protein [Caldithrix sp.]